MINFEIFKMANIGYGTKTPDSGQPSFRATLLEVFQAAAIHFNDELGMHLSAADSLVLKPPAETTNEAGEKVRTYTIPALPGKPATTYTVVVKEIPVQEIELIKDALDPDNKDVKYKTKPTEPAGAGYYWRKVEGTICGTFWVRTEIE